MNINHNSRMVYGSILLVLLVILYYYYTRLHEGFSIKKPSNSSTSNPPTNSINKPMAISSSRPMAMSSSRPMAPMGMSSSRPMGISSSRPMGMSRGPIRAPKSAAQIKAEQEEMARQREIAKREEMTRQIKDIKKTYSDFYKLLSDENKNEINKVYNHFIENVIKDDYPPFK